MRASNALLLLVPGAVADAVAGWDLSEPVHGLALRRLEPVRAATPDRPATRFSRLHNVRGVPGLRSATSAVSRALRAPPSRHERTYQNITKAGAFSTQYAIQCGWDGAPVWLLLDTGSSDTWAVGDGFECDSRVVVEQGQAACGFGRPLVSDFGHGAIPNLHFFFLRYGSGEKIVGPMGYSDLSCGGVRVAHQQVGLANYTYWHGNNLTIGILGLAYPSITSAFYGDIGSEAAWNAISYTPFLTNAIMQGAIDPVFSVALLKNSSGGMLAWGGLLPLDWRRGRSATTDLIIVSRPCQPRLVGADDDGQRPISSARPRRRGATRFTPSCRMASNWARRPTRPSFRTL